MDRNTETSVTPAEREATTDILSPLRDTVNEIPDTTVTQGLINEYTAAGLFPDRVTAEAALVELRNAGFTGDQLGLDMRDPWEQRQDETRVAGSGFSPGGVLVTVNGGKRVREAVEILARHGARMDRDSILRGQ